MSEKKHGVKKYLVKNFVMAVGCALIAIFVVLFILVQRDLVSIKKQSITRIV